MKSFEKLLLENKAWAREKMSEHSDYFKELNSDTKPDFLWIGCCDSKISADELTGTKPGEIYVHRNIANLVLDYDVNLLSIIEYALHIHHVRNIIVCGHYGCEGVKTAMLNTSGVYLNNWLNPLFDIYKEHINELNTIENEEIKLQKMVEWNVIEQCKNLSKLKLITEMNSTSSKVAIHGWVYGQQNGILKSLVLH